MHTELHVENIDHIQIIHNAIINAPTTKILKRMQKGIVSFVPHKLCEKYSKTVQDYMHDVNIEYEKSMKACNLRRCLASEIINDDLTQMKQRFRFKYSGRTRNYSKFLRLRIQLSEKLFLPYKFVRFILHSAKLTFPKMLNNFGKYREKSVWYAISEFERIVQRDLEENVISLKEIWYPKIVRIILKYYKKRILPPLTWPRVMNCVKGLINQQLTELKVNTFEHIFDILNDRKQIPPIKFQAILDENGICVYPTFDDLITIYQNIFKLICNVGTKLPCLERQIDRNAFHVINDFIKVEIPDVFMQQIANRLQKALFHAYNIVNIHVENWENEYIDLFCEDAKYDLELFLSEPKQIHEYLEKIRFYENFDNRLRLTVRNEYFDCGIVNQTQAIMGLRQTVKAFISQITNQIVNEHKLDCVKICDWFENVKKRAVETPSTTEALLANSEFMLQVKNKKMSEVHEYIQRNLKVRQFDFKVE